MINFRPGKRYIDRVVEQSLAKRKEPNEIGQLALMHFIDHKVLDFDGRLSAVMREVKRIGKLLEEALGDGEEEDEE